jgi:pyruvate/2-oxoglutarate dehydrogenase complex dihydrolipoamide acyltransferase (E2) component
MVNITVSTDLWSTSLFPEGILERWRVADGSTVRAGQVIAEITIGDQLHELIAPADGCLKLEARCNDVVEPGCLIGRIEPSPTTAK